MLNKRGQITVFIIIGILILFAFAFVFYIRGITVEKKVISARPVITEAPSELNPVVLYVEDCIKKTATRGLEKIGQNGGYINPEGFFSYENPTDSDGVKISENSDAVPYWLYNANSNKDDVIRFASLAPELERGSGGKKDFSIEAQLDRYVNDELNICLSNFSVFRKQGFEIKEKGDIDTVTSAVKSKVTFFVEYPLEISKGKTTAKLNKFYAEVDVPLKNIYETAMNITQIESEFSFLETDTLNLMESFSGVDSAKLPPMTDSTFEFGKKIMWPVISIEENVKSMLSSYVPLLRVYQSRSFYRHEFPQGELSGIKQRVYDNMILDLNKPVPYEVKFDYLNWPVYFDANDNAGVIIPQSSTVSYSGLNFGMQRYKTVYDISYPVIITIKDADAINKKGYFFTFALEANIRNNRAVTNGQEIPAPYSVFEKSMMCNLNQRNSAEYSLSAEDNYDKSDLSNAQAVFSAGDENCFIGETPGLKARLPLAYGGLITFVKQGYISKSVLIDTDVEEFVSPEEKNIKAEMSRIDEISVSVKKKKVVKCIAGICYPGSGFVSGSRTGWFFRALPGYALDDNEEAIVTLKRISDDEQEFSSAFSIKGDEEKQIKLAPGKYIVEITLLLNEELKIPEEIRCEKIKKGIFGEREDKECFTIPETIFDVFPSGGVNFDKDNYWELKPNTLYDGNKITFFAAETALADVPENLRTIDDIQQMNEISNISKKYKTELSPRIE